MLVEVVPKMIFFIQNWLIMIFFNNKHLVKTTLKNFVYFFIFVVEFPPLY